MNRLGKIYKAINKITNEVYIGVTFKLMKGRQNDHLQKAKKNVGGKFQQAIRTYGSEAFEWVQIDTANSSNELADKEKDYVIKYDAKDNGYNGDRGGGFQKNIYQYDLDSGVILSTFYSLTEAAENVGVDKKTISKACLGEIKNCAGYYWSYNLLNKYKAEEDLRKKKVIQFSLQGEVVRSYKSVTEAATSTGTNSSSIAKCCRGEYKIAGGFYWEYEN